MTVVIEAKPHPRRKSLHNSTDPQKLAKLLQEQPEIVKTVCPPEAMFLARSFSLPVELVQKGDVVVTDRPFILPLKATSAADYRSDAGEATQPVEAPGAAKATQPVEAPGAVEATQPVEAPGAAKATQPVEASGAAEATQPVEASGAAEATLQL